MTELAPGSNWNTMPSHTHERRMEIYTYFELPEGQVVFHMCGEPTQTRHIVMHNEDAVISLLEHSQRRRHLELYVYLGNGRREHGV